MYGSREICLVLIRCTWMWVVLGVKQPDHQTALLDRFVDMAMRDSQVQNCPLPSTDAAGVLQGGQGLDLGYTLHVLLPFEATSG